MTTYWHGGRRGRQRGEYILPPTITQATALSEYGMNGICRRDKVYVTTDRNAALMYASGWKNGVIYECLPVGELEHDPDCLEQGLSWMCEKAIVKRCIKPKKQDIAAARVALMINNKTAPEGV